MLGTPSRVPPAQQADVCGLGLLYVPTARGGSPPPRAPIPSAWPPRCPNESLRPGMLLAATHNRGTPGESRSRRRGAFEQPPASESVLPAEWLGLRQTVPRCLQGVELDGCAAKPSMELAARQPCRSESSRRRTLEEQPQTQRGFRQQHRLDPSTLFRRFRQRPNPASPNSQAPTWVRDELASEPAPFPSAH